MPQLRNAKREVFAREVANGVDPAQAYLNSGFTPHRANHNRLLRHPQVAARIEELRRQREDDARAARTPIEDILAELDRRGFDRVGDFFERDAAGILRVRDLQIVPVEVSIALLRFLHEGLGIKSGVL
jgi:hypothetical protein